MLGCVREKAAKPAVDDINNLIAYHASNTNYEVLGATQTPAWAHSNFSISVMPTVLILGYLHTIKTKLQDKQKPEVC